MTRELLGEALVTPCGSPDLSFIYSIFWPLCGALGVVPKPLSSNSLTLPSFAQRDVHHTVQSSKVILTSPSSTALPKASHPSLGS